MNDARPLTCLPIRYKTIMELSGIQPFPICPDDKKELWK